VTKLEEERVTLPAIGETLKSHSFCFLVHDPSPVRDPLNFSSHRSRPVTPSPMRGPIFSPWVSFFPRSCSAKTSSGPNGPSGAVASQHPNDADP